MLFCVVVQQPGNGINHRFFLEMISGTQGSSILVSFGTLGPVDDGFDVVV